MLKQQQTVCHQWEEQLAVRYLGNCTSTEHQALQDHLISCITCAHKREQYDALIQRVRAAASGEIESMLVPASAQAPVSQPSLQLLQQTTSPQASLMSRPQKVGRQRRQPPIAQGVCIALLLLLVVTGVAFLPHNTNSALTGGAGIPQSTPQSIPRATATTLPQVDLSNPYTFVRKPTLSVQRINAILQAYHSPMAGKGQIFYDLGLQYHVDPTFVLALSLHESDLGTMGEAVATKSLINLRCYTGVKCIDQNRGGYAAYPTWDTSIKEAYILIDNYYVKTRNITTVDMFIATWAPASKQQDEQAYATTVKNVMAIWRSGQLLVP